MHENDNSVIINSNEKIYNQVNTTIENIILKLVYIISL